MGTLNRLKLAAAISVLPVASLTATAVQAQSAAPLSVASSRAGASMDSENEQMFGGSWIIPVVIVVAIGLGLYFVLDDDDDEESTSP